MSFFKQFIQNKWFWIGAALCLLIALYSYFFRIPFLKINPIEAVSKDAAFILDIKEGTVYDLTQTYPFLQKESRLLNSLDSLFQISEIEQFTIAAFIHPRSGIDVLYVFDNKNIKKKFTSEYNFSTSEFKGKEVFHFQIDHQNLSCSTYKNLTFAAEKAFMVEDAIRELDDKQNNLLQDKHFCALRHKTPPPSNHLYIQLPKFAEIISSRSGLNKVVGFNLLLKNTPWFATDLAISTGFAKVDSSVSTGLDADEFIPDNALFHAPISLGKNAHFDWAINGARIVMTSPNNNTWENNLHLLIPFKDEVKTKSALANFAEQEGRVKAKQYLNYEINRLPQIHPFDFVFGAEHSGLNKPFYTILDGYVLFSNDSFTHQSYLDKLFDNQILSNNIEYLQFKEKNLSQGAPAYFFSEKGLHEWLKSNLRQDISEALLSQNHSFSYVHLYPNKKQHYDIKKSLSYKSKAALKMTWKLYLDAEGLDKPQFIAIPSTNLAYLLVQDKNHQLYCYDTEGKLHWKKPLESSILSDFFLVDYQKNGQYQILFNTENKIHLLDFNGRNIGRYPVDFRSRANNGLVCFDKDRHQNFVYFLAGKNSKIYGYELNGRPLQGWNPKETKHLITSNGLYFFNDKKDYITFVDKKNQLHSFDLKGTPHFEPVPLGNYLGQLAYDIAPQSKRFVVLKPNGKLKIVNLLGSTFNLATSSQAAVKDFAFADITGDSRKDYAVLTEKQLLVYSYNEDNKFEKAFDYTFDFPQDEIFTFREKSQSKLSIATLDNANQQVNVLSPTGQPLDGFPIEASSPFDFINQKDKLFLSVLKGKEIRFYQK